MSKNQNESNHFNDQRAPTNQNRCKQRSEPIYQLKSNACDQHQTRENACERFCFSLVEKVARVCQPMSDWHRLNVFLFFAGTIQLVYFRALLGARSTYLRPWSLSDILFYWGSRDGACAVVRALAFLQCGPGSIPGLGVICGLSLLLVFVLTPRDFFSGYSGFPKTNTSKFQFDLESVPN